MDRKEVRGILNKFIADAKKQLGEDLSYKSLYSHVKNYCSNMEPLRVEIGEVKRKKSTRKITTEPGDIFDASLCKCRVWNKGFGKQCSNKPKDGLEVCGIHKNSIDKYGGWSLGIYYDKQPSKHLFDAAGNTKKGDRLPWKDATKLSSNASKSNVKCQDPLVMKLKDKYEEVLGKRPRGPKASDIEWLRMKIGITSDDDTDSSDDELSFKNEVNDSDSDEEVK